MTVMEVSLAGLVKELFCNGILRRHYKDVNKNVPSVQNITHHGWIHIVMVVMIARVFGPFLGLKKSDELDEQSIVELGCLFHDVGLSQGRHRHAINGARMTEEILRSLGVDESTIEIVRLLVRFHRADDFVWLCNEIIPRWQFVLERMEEGDRLFDLVKTNDPDEDPSHEEVLQFLQLMRAGVPMMRLLSAVMVADLCDIGRARVRARNRKIFYKVLRLAQQRQGIVLEDILKSRQASYSQFDLANFAVTSLEVLLQNNERERIVSIVVQEEVHPPRSRHKRTRANIQQWEGLFCWARRFAHLESDSERRLALEQTPACVRTSSDNSDQQPVHLVVRGVHDREVCSSCRVEEIKKTYLAALVAASIQLGLKPATEIRSPLMY